MYDVFWWCSAMTRMDTRDTQRDVWERYPVDGITLTRSVLPPEEVTTFSLVRRLAYQMWNRELPGVIAVHSKALEGGLARKRPPSGADIEFAVEVAPGSWVDLLLQAKRIYENGTYKGWESRQIRDLRRWAAHNGNRTPGMLLYNAEVSPFGPPRHHVTLGGCCMSTVRCHGWRWPDRRSQIKSSPLAITLLVLPLLPTRLPSSLYGNAVPADTVNRYASPWECIFCPARLSQFVVASGNENNTVAAISPKDQIPEWADILLAAAEDQAFDTEGLTSADYMPFDKEQWNADYSIVLPYIESESAVES